MTIPFEQRVTAAIASAIGTLPPNRAGSRILDRFVVVGFVPDGAGGLAKLRLARREGRALIYAGRVGTGWDHKTARAIRRAVRAEN
jgi:hypothetical protein